MINFKANKSMELIAHQRPNEDVVIDYEAVEEVVEAYTDGLSLGWCKEDIMQISMGVYILGYVNGKREERKKKKGCQGKTEIQKKKDRIVEMVEGLENARTIRILYETLIRL